MKVSWRLATALVISAFSIVLLAWGSWPAGQERHFLSLEPAVPAPPTQLPAAIPTLESPNKEIELPHGYISEVLEHRRISLVYPARIRSRDSEVIRLTLESDTPDGLTPADVSGDIGSTGEVIEIPSRYETHNITAEARLDMAGMEYHPQEQISSPLSLGRPITFYWRVRPRDTGHFKGTVWLFVKFVDKTTGEQEQHAISAQVIEIQSTALFGLSGRFARTGGTIGLVTGGFLSLPFLENVFKYLLRRPTNHSS